MPLGLAAVGLALVVAGWSPPSPANAGQHSRPVVVAARPLGVGDTVSAGDVSVVHVADAGGLAQLLDDVRLAVGRHVLVAVPRGSPLVAWALGDQPALGRGHRRVELHLEASAVPHDALPGDVVDVLAAVVDAQASGGRVVHVATATLLGVAQQSVSLDVDVVGASRLLWAEAFGKAIHVLVRPPGDAMAPPDAALAGGASP